MKRVFSILLCLVLAGGVFGTLPASAEDYRPVMILERMDLSDSLAAPFGISKRDDDVTPAAVGTIENDSTKGKVLHISGRESSSAGLSVNLKPLQQKTEALSFSYKDGVFAGGEYYALTFSIRAAKGKSFYIMPVMGGGGIPVWNDDQTRKLTDSNGHLGNIEARYKVTDQWTTIGVTAAGELAFFIGDTTYKVYCPNPNSWCGLYFVTFTNPDDGIWKSPCTEDYYISNLNIWGPKALEATADGFVDGAARLPEGDQVSRSIEPALERLESIYNGLSAEDRNRNDVVRAKAAMDIAKEAAKTVRRPFSPQYTYSDPENLLAPYGDLENFDGSTSIWMEPEGGIPKFTLVEDDRVAKQGSKCLLISGRESRGDLSIDITPIVRANGGGKYYFSCWMKTREPGVTMEVLPMVLYVASEDDVKEYEIGECVVTDEWTFVGVTIQDIERFFMNQHQGLDDIGDNINYAVLRFYTADMEADEDRNPFPDFYVDDLKFWKDSEKLPGYVPSETTAAPVITTAEQTTAPTSTAAGSSGALTEEKPSSGTAGVVIGIVVGVAALAGLFVLFWFVIRPRMLAAVAGQATGENTANPAPSDADTDKSNHEKE